MSNAFLRSRNIVETADNCFKDHPFCRVIINNLEARIQSQEKELQEKQKIIEMALKQLPHKGARVGTEGKMLNTKYQLKQELSNFVDKTHGDNNSRLTPIEKTSSNTKSGIVIEDISDNEIIGPRQTLSNKETTSKQRTKNNRGAKPNKKDKRKNPQASINRTKTSKQGTKNTESKRIKILIVGDSQLRNLSTGKIENEHCKINQR